MATFLLRLSLVLSLLLPAMAGAMTPIALVAGWNLVGNSDAAPIDVAARLGDAGKITSVWKWNRSAERWAFYAPSMSSAALASYAQGKGYDVLARVEPREGFWVNAAAPTLLYDPLVAPPAPGSAPIALLDADLQAGWNLLAGADNKNPSQLHTDLGMALSARSIVSAWLWDAPLAKWKFFAPSLQAQGGTALAEARQSRFGYARNNIFGSKSKNE